MRCFTHRIFSCQWKRWYWYRCIFFNGMTSTTKAYLSRMTQVQRNALWRLLPILWSIKQTLHPVFIIMMDLTGNRFQQKNQTNAFKSYRPNGCKCWSDSKREQSGVLVPFLCREKYLCGASYYISNAKCDVSGVNNTFVGITSNTANTGNGNTFTGASANQQYRIAQYYYGHVLSFRQYKRDVNSAYGFASLESNTSGPQHCHWRLCSCARQQQLFKYGDWYFFSFRQYNGFNNTATGASSLDSILRNSQYCNRCFISVFK